MMNYWLLSVLGDVDADLVEEAAEKPSLSKKSPIRWTAAVAAVLVLAVCLSVMFGHRPDTPPVSNPDTSVSDTSQEDTSTEDTTTTTTQTTTTTTAQNLPSRVFAMATPDYSYLAENRKPDYGSDDYYDWKQEQMQKEDLLDTEAKNMTAFYADTMAALLREGTENRVFSPLNLYVALSMLAETAGGDSRQQILDLLGQRDLTALRQKNKALWEGVCRDDDLMICLLGNSLWLAQDDRAEYNESTLDTLARQYYAAAYRGEMGSEDYNGVLRDWINDHTGGLLSQQAENVKLSPATALALVSTLYFRGEWIDEFKEEDNREGVFHVATGDVTCTMMYQRNASYVYTGDRFTATSINMKDGAGMYIFLPNEGESVASLASDPQVLTILESRATYEDRESVNVDLTLPKFDVVSDMDLSDRLAQMGITDVFDAEKADFTGIFTKQSNPVKLDRVRQSARVTVDEKGVTAAAFTWMEYGMGGPIEDVEFTVDRPFMFAVIGPSNTILFAGIIENPNE